AMKSWERAGELGGTEIAAVTEGGGEVALARVSELGLKARQGAKVPGPVQPVIGLGQDIEDMLLRQTFTKQRLDPREVRWERFALQFPQNHLAVFQPCRGIGRKGGISRGRKVLQPGPQRGDKRVALNRQPDLLPILLHPVDVLLGRDQLRTIITERLASFHIEIA